MLIFDGAWPARFDGQPGPGVGSFHEMPGVAPGLAEFSAPGALIVAAAAPGAGTERREVPAPFAVRALEAYLGAGEDLAGGPARPRAALPDACFAGSSPKGAELAMPTDEERAEELALWRRTSEAGGAEAYVAYLEQYPDGYYAHAARDRLDAIEQGDADFAANREDALSLDAKQRRAILEALSVRGVPSGEDPVALTAGPRRDPRLAGREWRDRGRFPDAGAGAHPAWRREAVDLRTTRRAHGASRRQTRAGISQIA